MRTSGSGPLSSVGASMVTALPPALALLTGIAGEDKGAGAVDRAGGDKIGVVERRRCYALHFPTEADDAVAAVEEITVVGLKAAGAEIPGNVDISIIENRFIVGS